MEYFSAQSSNGWIEIRELKCSCVTFAPINSSQNGKITARLFIYQLNGCGYRHFHLNVSRYVRRIHFERIFVHSFAFQYASSAVLKISACFSRLKVEKFHLMKSADYYDISVSIFGSACIGCGFFFVDFMKMSPFMLFIFRMVCTTLVFAMILFFSVFARCSFSSCKLYCDR